MRTITVTAHLWQPARSYNIGRIANLRPPATLVIHRIHLTAKTGQLNDTSHIVYTIELNKSTKSLPLKAKSSIICILWSIRVTVRSLVLAVDDTIPIEIDNIIVSGKTLWIVCIMLRATNHIVIRIQISIINICLILTNGITSHLLIPSQQWSIVFFKYLIFRMGHAHISPNAHLIGKCLVDTKFQLITFGSNLT